MGFQVAEAGLHLLFELRGRFRIRFELLAAHNCVGPLAQLLLFGLRAGHEVGRLERLGVFAAVDVRNDAGDHRSRPEAIALQLAVSLDQQIELARRHRQKLVAAQAETLTGTGPELADVVGAGVGITAAGAGSFFGSGSRGFGISCAAAFTISTEISPALSKPISPSSSSSVNGAFQLLSACCWCSPA